MHEEEWTNTYCLPVGRELIAYQSYILAIFASFFVLDFKNKTFFLQVGQCKIIQKEV